MSSSPASSRRRGRRKLGSSWGSGGALHQVGWGLGLLGAGLGRFGVLDIGCSFLVVVGSIGALPLLLMGREEELGLDRGSSGAAEFIVIGELAELLLATAGVKR